MTPSYRPPMPNECGGEDGEKDDHLRFFRVLAFEAFAARSYSGLSSVGMGALVSLCHAFISARRRAASSGMVLARFFFSPGSRRRESGRLKLNTVLRRLWLLHPPAGIKPTMRTILRSSR